MTAWVPHSQKAFSEGVVDADLREDLGCFFVRFTALPYLMKFVEFGVA